MFTQTIINHLDTIVIAIVAVVLGWDRLRNGSGILQKQLMDGYKERNAQLEEKLKREEEEFRDTIKALQAEQNKMNIEIATFKATIVEKDKRIEELRQDLQGRNPEMIDLLTEISESNIEIKKFMQMMHDDSRVKMKHQTDILEGQVIREKKIDIASSNETGDLMRTPV